MSEDATRDQDVTPELVLLKDLISFMSHHAVGPGLMAARTSLGNEDFYFVCAHLMNWLCDHAHGFSDRELRLSASNPFHLVLEKAVRTDRALATLFGVRDGIIGFASRLSDREIAAIDAHVRDHYVEDSGGAFSDRVYGQPRKG